QRGPGQGRALPARVPGGRRRTGGRRARARRRGGRRSAAWRLRGWGRRGPRAGAGARGAVSATLMDGTAASEEGVGALQVRVSALPFTPRLTFVRVGDDPASAYYVRSKERLARRVGIASDTRVLPEGTSQGELLALVAELNEDPEVDGVLVQLPAPGVDEAAVLAAIDPAKDVDGLHPLNVGRLWTGRPGLRPEIGRAHV